MIVAVIVLVLVLAALVVALEIAYRLHRQDQRAVAGEQRAVAGTSLVCEACGCRWKKHPPSHEIPWESLQLYDADQRPCAECDNGPNPPLVAEPPPEEGGAA